MKPAKSVDCTGLFCPMPIVRTKQEMASLKPGEILEIVADDPGFAEDLPAWCAQAGEKLLEISREGRFLTGYIQKT